MKALFVKKSGWLDSHMGLAAITAMLLIFSLALPGVLVSSSGRLFAVVWAIAAIFAFTAHARQIVFAKKPCLPRFYPLMPYDRDRHFFNRARHIRVMREY